jgi:hypothetical protein
VSERPGEWDELLAAALIGTERRRIPDPGDDPAGTLLDRAAVLTAARRAGRLPDKADPPPPSEPDPRPLPGPAAVRRFASLLGEREPTLAAEWLTAAAADGLRVPDHLLPALLDKARNEPSVRKLIAAHAGPRARWLAGLNPDWAFPELATPDDDTPWRLGTSAERRGYLAAVRARDPGTARELVIAAWLATAAAERNAFLWVLADGLSPDDEPLLERSLDDRAREVRASAALLLARLPGSALARRMAERAVRFLRMTPDCEGPRIDVRVPDGRDDGLIRDGVIPAGGGRAALLAEVLARTPLRTWTDAFGMTPAEIVRARMGDAAVGLFTGWSRAAVAQRDVTWTQALAGAMLHPGRLETAAQTESLLRVLEATPAPWPAELTARVLTLAERELPRRLAFASSLLRLATYLSDPRLGAPGAAADPPPGTPRAIANVTAVLRLRHDMLAELDPPHPS